MWIDWIHSFQMHYYILRQHWYQHIKNALASFRSKTKELTAILKPIMKDLHQRGLGRSLQLDFNFSTGLFSMPAYEQLNEFYISLLPDFCDFYVYH